MDADAVFLQKNWDKILINLINEQVKIVGTQGVPGKSQDFPWLYAILLETKTFLNLKISFVPKNQLGKFNPDQDTGYQLREKYLAAGYQGLLLQYVNTRYNKKGPFGTLLCGEYYWQGQLFASHFGRGSTLGAAKYSQKYHNFFLKILDRIRVYLRGYYEKIKWLKIVKKIINSQ